MLKNRIAYWADLRGIKHKHIAKQCGVSIQTFSRWVNNRSQPDLIQSAIIARMLDISIDELVKEEEKE